jgi:predicted nucleic acid-binding protein
MTTIVIDANIALALILPLPYSRLVARQMGPWSDLGARIVVPLLWEYEIVSGLRRAISMGMLSQDEALDALETLLSLDLEVAAPTLESHRRALDWSARLGQRKAYDSQYLATAELAGAELWTADQRLANAALAAGASWVRSVWE